MSGQFAIVPAEIFQSRLSSQAKLVFCCLRLHADKGGTAFPSLTRLQKEASLSRWSILKGLSELESSGLVSRTRRRSASGDPDSTLYRLTGGCLSDELPCLSDGQRCSADEQGVVCQTNRGCLSDELYQYHLSRPMEHKDGENSELSPSKGSSSKPSLEAKDHSQGNPNTEIAESGDMEPESVFLEKVKADFRELVGLYPKKEGASKKAFELYKAFFSRERQHFKRNDFRATNVFSAVEGYRRSCEDQEQRYIKSLSRFLEELDPDQEVTEIVTVYGQRKAS